jgi:hypothetical protein
MTTRWVEGTNIGREKCKDVQKDHKNSYHNWCARNQKAKEDIASMGTFYAYMVSKGHKKCNKGRGKMRFFDLKLKN